MYSAYYQTLLKTYFFLNPNQNNSTGTEARDIQNSLFLFFNKTKCNEYTALPSFKQTNLTDPW